MADPDVSVREAAERAIAGRPGNEVCRAILALLAWGDASVVRGVDAALPRLKSVLEDPLIETLQDDAAHRDMRAAAAYALGRVASQKAVEILTTGVWLADPVLSGFCANALVSIDHPDSLRAFLRMTGHVSPEVRRAAYLGLAKLGGPDARGVLLKAASGRTESDFKNRQLTVRLLGTVGDAETVEFLIELVKAKSGFVRPATDALALMTGLPNGMAGERWVEWYNEVWKPAKQGGKPPPLVPSDRRAPMGFPADGFPFIP